MHANRPATHRRLLAPLLGIVTLGLLLALQSSAQVVNAFVADQVLVSSTRVTSTLTDFRYTIRVVNQGGALRGARATVRSLVGTTEIRDAVVELGDVPAGTTITSTDTFTLRQDRRVAFNPANLVWTIQGALANTPPLADAGVDQTVRTGVTVTLDGTRSSDADGNALGYRWALVTRPAGSAATLTGANTPRPTFVADRNGNYAFSLVVNDGQVDSSADTVGVSTINSAPVADAGPDRTVARASLVTLDGSASSDPDVDALTYQWTVVGRPNASTAVLTGADTVNPRIQLDQPGDYRFQLVVSDGTLASSPDVVAISTQNSAPVANPGPNQMGTRGVRVNLDASGSSDADGDALAFSWSWASQPQGSNAVLEATDPLRPFFTPDVFGDYVLQLIVNDGWVNSAPATVTISVPRPANRAPNAVADTASTPADTPVTIAVLANDTDPDADPLTIAGFTQPANGTVVQVGSALRYTPAANFTGPAVFQYTVTDDVLTASAAVTVTVAAAANLPPTVDAGPDQLLTAPYPNALVGFTLTGRVSDDGRPTPANLTQSWSRVSGPGPASIAAAASLSTGVQVGTPGLYTFRLGASDGALAASDDVVVEVRPAANAAPTLAPIPNRTIRTGDTLRLQVAASDPDPFDTLTYSLGSGPGGATLSATGELAWTAGSPGSATFTIDVRDAGNLGASATFTVTVQAGNRPPVLGPLANDVTRVGAAYARSIAATDPDGGPVTLSLLGGPAGLTLTGNTITWRPGAAQTGGATVRVLATDAGGATAGGAYRIEVESATPPLARDDSYKVQLGQTLTVAAPGVLANDSSVDGATLGALRRSDPALGTVDSFAGNGGFTYTAPATDPRPPFTLTGRTLTDDLLVGVDLGSWAPLADLDRDGRPDLVTTSFFRATATSGGTGARLWNASSNCTLQVQDGPGEVLADIDDDGRLEYVHVARCPGEGGNLFSSYTRVQALADDGSVEWTSAPPIAPVTYVPCTSASACGSTPVPLEWTSTLLGVNLTTGRLAASEAPVLMYRQYVPSTAAQVFGRTAAGTGAFLPFGCQVMTGDAADFNRDCMVTVLLSATTGERLQLLRSAPRRNAEITTGNPYPQNSVLPVDLDGDGTIELVAGADAWRRSGGGWTLAWQAPVEPEQVVIADLDGDGRPEVIHHVNYLTTSDTSIPVEERPGFSGLLVYGGDGVLLRRIPVTTQTSGRLSAADADGDGLPELMFTQGGIAYAFAGDGTLKWTYQSPSNPLQPQPLSARTSRNTNMMAYDLDGDGNREVVFSPRGYVVFLDGRTGLEKARFDTGLQALGPLSNLVHVTDWDDDGHADVVVVNQRGSFPGSAFPGGLSPAGWVVTSSRNDWLPAPKFHGQQDFRDSGFDDAGRVLFDASAPRQFRNPRQLGTVRDPRVSAGTSFTYVASDGLVESAPATVFLELEPTNRAPVITSTPPTAFLSPAGLAYRVVYRVLATDPDPGDTLTYSVSGFSTAFNVPPPRINAATGEVEVVTTNSDFTTEVFVTVTDSRGATATQSFVVNTTGTGIAVPNLVGQPVATAAATLAANRLQYRVAQEQFSATVPKGSVISQDPAFGGAPAPRLGTVALVVSKGAQPAVVPNVVGLLQSQANTRLLANGFTTGAVTRQFSATVARGEVLAQSPAGGGEQVPGAVAVTVSAGNGLALRLRRSVTTADAPIPFVAVSQDLDGAETPATGLSFAITPLQSSGPNPIVSGASIVPARASRGGFRLTITDGGGRSASATFVVGEPVVAGEAEPMAAAFARLSAALEDINGLILQARTALAEGNVAQQESLLRQMVQRWRQVDLVDLSLSIALAPENGFAPLVSQMAGFGVDPTADDLVSRQVLEDSDADLREWIDALRAPNTPLVELNRLADQFGSRAARLDAVTISEWGHANNASLYTLILARRIPALYEAIMDELAQVVGLPPTRVAALAAPGATGSPGALDPAQRSLFAGLPAPSMGATRGGDGAQLNSTLAELAVTQATQWVVDKVIEDFNAKYKAGKQYATDIMTQAFGGAAVMVAVSHIRQFVQGQDTGEIVSGASLSFRRFESPYSFIEGPWDLENPEMNQVFVIGPSLIDDVQPFITKFQNAMKFRQTLNPLADDGKYKSAKEIKRDLKDFKSALEDLKQGAQDLVETIARIEQTPTGVDRPCLFDASPDCGQLLFEVGFRSVYKYTPPPGFEGFTGLPLPIVFVVYNYRNNTMYFATPPFLPTPAQ